MNDGDWISLASVIVAICAIGISLYYARSQSRREFMMAQPSLTPVLTTKLENQIGILSAGVVNDGLGPAKLMSFTPTLNGERFELRQLVDHCADGVEHRKLKLSKPAINSALAPGRTMIFVEVACFAKSQDELDAFARLFDSAKIEVSYRSFLESDLRNVTIGN